MAEALAVNLHSMSPETATGAGTAVDLVETRRTAAELELQVIAANVDIDVTIQTSDDSGGPWRDVAAFATIGAPGSQKLAVADLLQFIRASWTTTGGSVEWSLNGYAHTLYCKPSQLEGPGQVFSGLSANVLAQACIDASGEAESYIAGGYEMPITAWPPEVTRQTGLLAAWNAVRARGVRADGADEVVLTERDHAAAWFNRIMKGSLRPPGIVDSSPSTYEGGGFVVSSSPSRGW